MAGGLAVLITMGTLKTSMAHDGGGRLEGTWETQVSIIDCQGGNVLATFANMPVFVAGGTMIESTSGTAPALRTQGEGVWRHATGNNYAFSFKFFTFNSENVFTGWTVIAGETTVDATGETHAGSATVEVHAPNGVLVATACAAISGTRFEL